MTQHEASSGTEPTGSVDRPDGPHPADWGDHHHPTRSNLAVAAQGGFNDYYLGAALNNMILDLVEHDGWRRVRVDRCLAQFQDGTQLAVEWGYSHGEIRLRLLLVDPDNHGEVTILAAYAYRGPITGPPTHNPLTEWVRGEVANLRLNDPDRRR